MAAVQQLLRTNPYWANYMSQMPSFPGASGLNLMVMPPTSLGMPPLGCMPDNSSPLRPIVGLPNLGFNHFPFTTLAGSVPSVIPTSEPDSTPSPVVLLPQQPIEASDKDEEGDLESPPSVLNPDSELSLTVD